MTWKISNIEIGNFKFFKETFSLNTERKNILLYGENGSGKSSIYWSAYTHFQACMKDQVQAQKYFMDGHPENLRNRFAANNLPSYVKISFDDDEGNQNTIEDSNVNYYSADAAYKQFMKKTSMSSDFMNYKFLYSLFDFKNSEDNEVFKILEKDALPYFDLDEQLIDINGVALNTFNAEDWWDYIQKTFNTPGIIPKKRGSTKHFKLNTEQYRNYQKIIEQFNRLLNNKLIMLVGVANSRLHDVFKTGSRLRLEYENATFNKKLAPRKYDGELKRPKVKLKAEMTSPLLVNNTPVNHPRSFFNEAKMTCMALALRLAILESHPQAADSASVLFVDDLLISLDMPLRRKVIDILLGYSDTFQMFILTHDRAFYNLTSNEIAILGKSDYWKKYELYIDVKHGYEEPVLVNSKKPLEKAKQFLAEHEISASVNAARRAAEEVLKKLLPTNLVLDLSYTGQCDLNGLIQKFNNFMNSIGLNNPAPHLHNARQLILNPFSHDDIETPFYKDELKMIIKEIEELFRIERTVIIDYKDVRSKDCQFKMENNATNDFFEGDIVFLETFNKYTYNGQDYFNYPKVKLNSSNKEDVQCKEWGLNRLYNKVANYVGLNTHNRPQLIDCLYDKATGNNLVV